MIFRVNVLVPICASLLSISCCLATHASAKNNYFFSESEIQDALPESLSMRIPSEHFIENFWQQTGYLTHVFSIDSPPSLIVGIYSCTTGSAECSVGQISVEQGNSLEAQQKYQEHQNQGAPITLAANIQGFLVEGYRQTPGRVFASVVWRQDGLIYSAELQTQERQTLLYLANSMANTERFVTNNAEFPETLPNTEANNVAVIENSHVAFEEQDLGVNADQDTASSHQLITASASNSSGLSNSTTESSSQQIQELAQDSDDDFTPPGGVEDSEGPEVELAVVQPSPDLQVGVVSAVLSNSDVRATTDFTSTTFYNSARLSANPILGTNTRLSARLSGDLVRFVDDDGYNSINALLGIQQAFDENVFGELGWSYRQLYGLGSRDDLSEHSARLNLNITESLSSQTFIRASNNLAGIFANPDERSRVSNTLSITLSHQLVPRLNGLLNYSFVYEDFTQEDITAIRQQVSSQLIYQLNQEFYVGASASYLFGDAVDLFTGDISQSLENLSFGFYIGAEFPFEF